LLPCSRCWPVKARREAIATSWHIGELASAGAAATDWELVADQLATEVVKTGGRLVRHARYYWLLLAENHLTRRLFRANAGQDRSIAFARRVGEATTGSDFSDERQGGGKVSAVWVENGSVWIYSVLGIGKMAPSVTDGSARKSDFDFPLWSEAVGCRLSVGPEIDNGNDGTNLLRAAGLPGEATNRRVEGYSKGMRQKVGLAIAAAKNAKPLFLDEPTSGLDPKASNSFSESIAETSANGVAILMATHDLFRAKESGTRIGIMRDGVLREDLRCTEISHSELEQLYLYHMN